MAAADPSLEFYHHADHPLMLFPLDLQAPLLHLPPHSSASSSPSQSSCPRLYPSGGPPHDLVDLLHFAPNPQHRNNPNSKHPSPPSLDACGRALDVVIQVKEAMHRMTQAHQAPGQFDPASFEQLQPVGVCHLRQHEAHDPHPPHCGLDPRGRLLADLLSGEQLLISAFLFPCRIRLPPPAVSVALVQRAHLAQVRHGIGQLL
mmetsp:Transcript_92428/g.232471  ORF Transcript_92428/g.232471 Transcript_92428/m.232471 type:complete len:203 (-) Transcript_92428:204-812(-)